MVYCQAASAGYAVSPCHVPVLAANRRYAAVKRNESTLICRLRIYGSLYRLLWSLDVTLNGLGLSIRIAQRLALCLILLVARAIHKWA